MTINNFPNCCGIAIVSGFDPLTRMPKTREQLYGGDRLIPNLMATTARQPAAEKGLAKLGFRHIANAPPRHGTYPIKIWLWSKPNELEQPAPATAAAPSPIARKQVPVKKTRVTRRAAARA